MNEPSIHFSGQEIPEEMIDAFVNSIIVYKDHFEWNLKLTEEPICCKVDGTKRKSEVSLVESPLFVGGSTGCTQQQEGLRRKPLKLGTFVIQKDYLEVYKKYHPETKKVNGWKDIILTIQI